VRRRWLSRSDRAAGAVQIAGGKAGLPNDPTALPVRISRDKLNLNVSTTGAPPFAPDFRQQSGALLDPGNFSLNARGGTLTPRIDTSASPLKGSVFAKALADFDIELIVDESMSMRRRDCPGQASRWEWCGMQLQNLSNQLEQYTPNGFTLTTFGGAFETYPRARSTELRQLFAFPQFTLGTRLAAPLSARLANYFRWRKPNSKPLLIVVITDGVPAPREEPVRVADTLIDATHKMSSPNEVTIVFFQIGSANRYGRFFLDQMDNALTSNGARYDIVRTVSFEQLQQQGLTQSLISTVRNFAHQAAR
jgi:hypothetical protein